MSEKPAPIVLNVDDYEAGRFARTKILQQAGFTVQEAATGGEALRLTAERRPAVVLLDVNLPDMTGFEVCRRLKTDPSTSSIPILHVSATFINAGHRVLGLEGGADGYLVEPVEPPVLVATVNALLRMREAEEALRGAARQWQATFESISDGVALLDTAGAVRQCNARFAELFGLDCPQVVGRSIQNLWQLVGVDGDSPIGRSGADPERQVAEVRVGPRWLRITADPVLDDGALRGAVCIVVDTTERRQADEDRAKLLGREQAARAEAEAASLAKDEFLATVSHELRAPLNAIMGWARLLRTQGLDEGRRNQALETIERSVRLQAQLIEDLLDVSRIISGRLRLEFRPVEVSLVMAAAVDSVRPGAEAKAVQLKLDLQGALPPMLVDPERIQQVVWNLLSNAVKFTPRGGRVEVRLDRHADSVRIVVADTGRGISPEFLPYVFDRFRQAETTSARAHGGLGIGLAIVRHLVEAHGGTVRAESAGDGQGATFTVLLPASRLQTDAGMTDRSSQLEAIASPIRLDDVRVLVVEDDPDSRNMLAVALGSFGATVTTADSVQRALVELDRSSFDALVSDIAMPGEDGYTLIRELRARPAERGGAVPAVALTAYASAQDHGSALAAGYQTHIAKPVDPTRLVQAIATLVGRG